MAKQLVFLVVLMGLLSCCTAFAADWYVATNGLDSNAGTIGAPFATLQGAIYFHAQPGDTVWVRAGTYTGLMNINGGDACGIHLPDYALLGGAPGAPITVRPYDGDFTAIFTGGVRLVRCKYITLMGLDMQTATGGHPLSVTSGCTGTDFYSPEHRSNHLLVQNCKIHDGGTSSGQCKLQQSDTLTVQDCEFWNLGAGGGVLDCVYVNRCVFQRNYMHDNYSIGGFVKGGSLYNTFDGNVYVNPSTAINWGFLPGSQTDPPFCPPDVAYESMYTVIRNNIVKGAQRGAMASEEAAYCYAYNNLWYDCAGGNSGYSYVTCLSTGMPRHDNYARHFYIFNNIFYDPQGDMRAYGWAQGGSGYWEDWQTGNNNYSNNGQALTVDTSFINPNNETAAQFGDPHLTLSGSPSTRQAWINYFRPAWDSQSNAMLKDKGNSNAGNVPYPVVIADIEGNPRPRDSGWDIGPYEYQGTVVTPGAEFTGDPLWGVPPTTISFTDCSSGGPTAWSWTFGDGSTSTAKNPSHTYNSNGSYNVGLTAYNSAGNNNKTKTGYIVIKPLDANFSASPVGGGVPLAVTFTDSSSNSPTAWSWTFGDGGTSTAQNPSHTYNTAGYYSVSLTATNANGPDTETKNNYITACTAVYVYPTACNLSGDMSVISGSVSDLQTENGIGMEVSCKNTPPTACPTHTYVYFAQYVTSSGYTPDQVYGMTVEYKVRTTVSGLPSCLSLLAGLGTGDTDREGLTSCPPARPVPSSFTSYNYDLLGNMTHFMESNGTLKYYVCNQNGIQTGAYHIVSDVMRWRLYLKPGGTPAPVANFSGTPTSGTAPLAVSFTDSSTNTPTAWSWTFGDSSTSTAQNPSHTYNSVGSYTVALTATNAGGNNTNTKNNYITVGAAPVANFTGNPTIGAPTLAVNFTDTSTNTPTAWSWTFGDSNTSTAQNPSHSYTAVGNYTVALTATNAYGNNTNTKNNYITVGNAPVANFSGTPTIGAAPLAVTFTDSSTNSPTAWSWTFGDSTSSTVHNPSHTYNSVGTYTVALTATNAYGNNTNTKNNYISAGAAPVANFSGTPTIGAPTLAVSFTDSSTNAPTAWSWTFGDSNTSTAENPSHSYTAVGNYTVALTGTNAYGNNTNTKNNYITVGNKPVANFSGTPTIGAPTLAVSFTDSSTYSPTAWAWTFGDSNSSTVQNPSHSYTAVGNYTVALTATNAYGNNTNTKNNYITVGNKPVANFSGTPLSGTAPLAVTFTDSSTYSPTAWAWTFGDSGTSTVQNPSHTYNSSGNYTVALTATNVYGNNTNTKNNYVSVSSGSAPVANFTANTTLGLASLAVTFTDTSTNTPTSWAWTFGDSSTSTVQNPSHTYTGSGYYTVALTATNAFGNNTDTKTDYITVCNEVTIYPSSYEVMIYGGGTYASGALTDVQSSNDAYMVFNSNTSNQCLGIRYKWTTSYTPSQTKKMIYDIEWHGSRADNPTYDISTHKSPDDYPTLMDFALWPTTDQTFNWTNSTDPGNYIVNGEIWMDICGCHQNTNNYQTSIDLQRIKLWVVPSGSAPVANFSGAPTSGAAPLAVTFTDSSTNTPTAWSWTFGDSNTSTVQNPSHTYASAGTYTVALTATNQYGNNTNTKNNYITAGNAPVANFSGTPLSGAAPLAVSFTDSSTNTPTAWSWTFGDSNTSTAQNPSHSYTAGTYTVTLTATNAYGSDGETKTNYITAGNAPVANFSGTPLSGAAPLAVSFTDSSTNTPTAWSWTFGDSNTSTAQNPSHTYAAGTYTVTLTATNAYGSDGETKTNYISVTPPAPVANFSGTPTTGNAPLAVNFTDSSTNTPTAWSWTFGDSNTSTAQNPSHTYAAGTYTVSLTATNAGGSDGETKTNYITASSVPAPVANFSGTPTTGYLPLIVDFTDASTNTPTAWSWNFGDTNYPYNTSTEQDPTKWYVEVGTFTVSLTATNGYGDDTMTKTNYCTSSLAPNAPTPNFSAAPTSGSSPLTVAFTDSSTGAGCWDWQFGDGTESTVQNPSHVYTAPGTYTVKLLIHGTNGYCNNLVKTDYITVSAPTPTYVAAGAVASGTGTITPALPGSLQTNDILLLFLETANQAISITNQNGGTWTQVTNSPQSVGTAGGSNGTRLTIFWSRYNGSQGAPTASDSGNHQLGRVIAIRGATTSGDPCNVTAGNTEATVDTSGAIAGATTTVANTLVAAAIATSLPDASGTANFSAWTNADLTSLTERTDNTVTAGNGGGLGIATGVKASAGAYTTTAVTCGTATTKAMISIAIRP